VIWDIASRIWDKLGYMRLAGMGFCGMMGASGETLSTTSAAVTSQYLRVNAPFGLLKSPQTAAEPSGVFAYLGWAYG